MTLTSWKLDFQHKSITNTNSLSITTLNTHNKQLAHIDAIVHDTQLMNNMLVCLQENHMHTQPKK